MDLSSVRSADQIIAEGLASANLGIEKFLKIHGSTPNGALDRDACAQAIHDICQQMTFPPMPEAVHIDSATTQQTKSNLRELVEWVSACGMGSEAVGTTLKTSLYALRKLLTDFDADTLIETLNPDRLLADGLNTPLTAAIRAGDVVRARQLLQWGARADISDQSGMPPLYLAVANDDTAMIELLAPHMQVDAPLTWSTMPQARGPCHREDIGASPLLHAIQEDKLQAYEALLRAGALAQIKYEHVWRPLVEFQESNPMRAARFGIGKNVICREYFAAKLLSHSLKLKSDDLPFSGGILRLESSKSNWFCLEMLDALQAFNRENPGRLQPGEMNLLESLLGDGAVDQNMTRNNSAILKTIKRSGPTGPIIQVHTGYEGHAVEWVFFDQYLMICNKGAASRQVGEVFRIDKAKLSPRRIAGLFEFKKLDRGRYETWLELLPITFGAVSDDFTRFIESTYPIEQLDRRQKGGFCAWASPETAIFFTLAMARFLKHTQALPTPEAVKELQETFIHLVRFMQVYAMEKYLTQVNRAEIPLNRPLVTLAIKQIKRIAWPAALTPRVEPFQAIASA